MWRTDNPPATELDERRVGLNKYWYSSEAVASNNSVFKYKFECNAFFYYGQPLHRTGDEADGTKGPHFMVSYYFSIFIHYSACALFN